MPATRSAGPRDYDRPAGSRSTDSPRPRSRTSTSSWSAEPLRSATPTTRRRLPMTALRSYLLLIRWQALRYRQLLPLMVIVQAALSFGIVAGYPLLFPELDQNTILFLATGAPAVALLTMGLVLVPQIVSGAKTEGSLEYVR